MTSQQRSQPGNASDELRAVLGAFYKTVDVMKSARNKPDHLMSVWADDMKAVEDVMLFLERLRDATPTRSPEGDDMAREAPEPPHPDSPHATDHVTVPREPTREMWAAGGTAACEKRGYHHYIVVEAVYRAMIDAATPLPSAHSRTQEASDGK